MAPEEAPDTLRPCYPGAQPPSSREQALCYSSRMDNHETRLEIRLQEAEIKLAFLERELGEYKEAVNAMHDLLTRLEKQVQELKEGEDSSRNIEEFWKPEEP